MRKGFIMVVVMLAGWGMVFQPVRAEEEKVFKPAYNFYGTVEFAVNSYFGDYPVIDSRNSTGWGYEDTQVADLASYYGLDNPTRPDLNEKVELGFYANPLPDLEVFLKPRYQGSLIWDQVYICYYSEKARYTLGSFKVEMGALGLVLGDNSPFDALMVNTKWKETWVTGLISQLNDDYYNGDSANFPYLGQATDDLIACRFSRKYGENYLGLNLVLDGFDNEKAVSLDFNGKFQGRAVTAEGGVIFPSALNRNYITEEDTEVQVDEIHKGLYPGLVMSVNLADNYKNMVRLTLGGMTKGFWSLYGTRAQQEMEEAVKFGRNLWGLDLLWQHALQEDWFLTTNLTWMEPIERGFFEQYQKHVPMATRVLAAKLKKQLSPRSEISGTLKYMGDVFFDYGKLELKWRTAF